jgi:hypothetical protein
MNILPAFTTGQLHLLVADHPHTRNVLFDLAAALALRGPLRVLDCGNLFNVYPVAQAVRRHTPGVQAVLERIFVSRAFTCYQVGAMLFQSAALSTPFLVLDLLASFQDESVLLNERQRLLVACLPHLQRLSRSAPVLITARSAAAGMLEMVAEVADQVWAEDAPALSPLQPALLPPSLFGEP